MNCVDSLFHQSQMSLPHLPKEPKHSNSLKPCARVIGSLPERSIAARLTGAGKSAIAVIGVRGPAAERALEACFRPATDLPLTAGQIRYGEWKSGESVVVTPVKQEHLEIHCHGGEAAIASILNDLTNQGILVVPAEEIDDVGEPLLIREAKEVLRNCSTTRTAAIAMHQVRGALQNWADQYQAESNQKAPYPASLRPTAQELIARARFTARMSQPLRVVLIGSPNVGKSSLVNAMLGFERSITTSIAGTTRDVLHASTVVNGVPVQLSDTAGVRIATDEIEREGVLRAKKETENADVVMRVRDHQHDYVEIATQADQMVIDVWNKCDLGRCPPSAERTVSAASGEGISLLLQEVVARMVPDGVDDGGPAILNQRQLAWVQSLSER